MTRRRSDDVRGRIGKIILVAIILVLLITAIVVVGYLYEKNHSEFQGSGSENVGSDKTIEYNGKTYVYNPNVETVLIIGLDAFGEAGEIDSYNNDKQADFLVLLVLNRADKTCKAIHINRDTMTDVPVLGVTGQQIGVVNQQISISHTYGNGGIDSCHNVAVTVSRMMYDLPIDNYVSMTMNGIKTLNDLIGGVTLTVLDDFSGVDDTLIKGEEVTLLGDHALNYVRSRNNMEDSTNENRMIRQRQYMQAIYEQGKVRAEGDDDFVLDVLTRMSDYIVSNCSIGQIDNLFEKAIEYDFGEIKVIEGESVKGEQYMEFHYDADALKKLVVETFYTSKTE